MTLVRLEMDIGAEPLPAAAERLIQVADTRVEIYQQTAGASLVVGFVPSDLRCVHGALAAIRRMNLATGRLFCEWGSGMGGATCLAALLEFDAYGIEIEGTLVELARRLAADVDLPAEFAEGSFVPPRWRHLVERHGTSIWLDPEGPDAYAQLGMEPDDFDVVFAYPWPGEEEVLYELFDHMAADGAILVTYQGLEGMGLHRKTPRPRKRCPFP